MVRLCRPGRLTKTSSRAAPARPRRSGRSRGRRPGAAGRRPLEEPLARGVGADDPARPADHHPVEGAVVATVDDLLGVRLVEQDAAPRAPGRSCRRLAGPRMPSRIPSEGRRFLPAVLAANARSGASPGPLVVACRARCSGGAARRRDPVTIYLDGAAIPAERGEPLAAALLAADKTILARSPKLHRPRGPSCFRGGCDGCLARVDGVPNVMTCLVARRAAASASRRRTWSARARPTCSASPTGSSPRASITTT